MTESVELRVYAELNDFLAPELRGSTVPWPFRPHQTVKDLIEAVGVPHTEVDLVVIDGESVGFDAHPRAGDRIAVYPVFESFDVGPIGRLRPRPLREPRFVVDVNLGRLARLLWLVGLDARWEGDADDADLAAISEHDRRVLLTRDRGLLKRRNVTHGLYVRSDRAVDQAVDVIRRLDLADRLAPFTRCLRCGGLLATVDKAEVLHRLEPLTKRYYDDFRQCETCGQLYWRGSHHERLTSVVNEIRAAL